MADSGNYYGQGKGEGARGKVLWVMA